MYIVHATKTVFCRRRFHQVEAVELVSQVINIIDLAGFWRCYVFGFLKNKLEYGHMPNVMAALGIIPFLLLHRKVWLMLTAQLPYSNAANIGECKTWRKVNFTPGRIPFGAIAPKNVYSIPSWETAKHRSKFR